MACVGWELLRLQEWLCLVQGGSCLCLHHIRCKGGLAALCCESCGRGSACVQPCTTYHGFVHAVSVEACMALDCVRKWAANAWPRLKEKHHSTILLPHRPCRWRSQDFVLRDKLGGGNFGVTFEGVKVDVSAFPVSCACLA